MDVERPMLKRDSADLSSQLTSFDSTPYPVGARSSMATISSRFSFGPDPKLWGTAVDSTDLAESDDDELYLSEKGMAPRRKEKMTTAEFKKSVTSRGVANAGCLVLLIVCSMALFVGYPVATFVNEQRMLRSGSFTIAGANATGQIPVLTGNFGLIDADTPKDAYTRTSWADGSTEMQLVFSDEFNVDDRSFYPGDDAYWEAVDLHYWETNNLEWYDPEAVTTKGGSLVITLSQKETHGLNYEGGMLSTWNKFCFTGGYIETSVQLPGANNILGLWPAIWTMGNLGRAGYGASLEGMWPYSYDSCDVGTVANQTVNGQPAAATINGDDSFGGVLSYLPGQRLSRCTCKGETHPGPKHNDGTFVGRSAPEIDIFEAQIDSATLIPEVSQSAQWAPFDASYKWNSSPDNMVIANPAITQINSFAGSITQEATSLLTNTNPQCYELSGGCYSVYGFEYKPGFDDAYITWIATNQIAWTLKPPGVGANDNVGISARPIPQEPMYLIANLGMSRGFATVDLDHLVFPVHMSIDYIRVYQPKNSINIGCNPKDFPTEKYINQHIEAYTNPNLTTWVNDYQQPWPKNSYLGQC